MIGIDWLFIGGASGIVGAAIIEKFADDYGFTWVGPLLRAILPLVSIATGFVLFDTIAEVFVL